MAIFYERKETKDKVVIKFRNRIRMVLAIFTIFGMLLSAILFAYSIFDPPLLILAAVIGLPSIALLLVLSADTFFIGLEIGNAMKKGKVTYQGTPLSFSDYTVEFRKEAAGKVSENRSKREG